MPLLINDGFHLRSSLEELHVRCLPQATTLVQDDLRTLRIGIINLMPQAETYEFNLLLSLGRTQLQVEPVWIRLKSHGYRTSDERNLSRRYLTFGEATSRYYLDGLILTGAPVEEMPFEEVNYWQELREILDFARANIASTLGICWGAMALARLIGIEKVKFERKLFGVFETRNLKGSHPLMSETDDLFWCPQSRFAGFEDERLELEEEKGKINLLAHSEEAGYVIFETTDHRFLMHLGHPEYNSRRLVEESLRDRGLNRTDVGPPKNFDVARPVNCWRGHRATFFSRWINYLYETTSYIYATDRA
ncbi:MAG TPA: homoserine O-succinyltransferase [Pyrinomonadaceae bacterium]|nr:homoserine O-succinyltransferase [Pyrinomonadaceae bacterium]